VRAKLRILLPALIAIFLLNPSPRFADDGELSEDGSESTGSGNVVIPQALGQGTEGGGGGVGWREELRNEFQIMLQPLFTAPGAQPYRGVDAWCSRVTTVLSEADSIASAAAAAAEGGQEKAIQIVVIALEEIVASLEVREGYHGPLALGLAQRALEIHQAIDEIETPHEQADDTVLLVGVDPQTHWRFLRSYTRFAKSQIEEFDRRIFVPYQFDYLPCYADQLAAENHETAEPRLEIEYAQCNQERFSAFDTHRFYRGFENFAQSQLAYIGGVDLIREEGLYDSRSIVPVRDERVVLRMAEMISRHVSQDLVMNPVRHHYGCIATRLASLSRRLHGFNSGLGFTDIYRGQDGLRRARFEIAQAMDPAHCPIVPEPEAETQTDAQADPQTASSTEPTEE
jgi:hypothetical protein